MLLAALSLATALTATANEVPGGGFRIPVECELGTDCWIVNYPDAGAGAERLDFRCNHLTFDGHKGTDFAVRDLATMYRGVTVVAAADGRVLRVRDGVGDNGAAGVPDDRACGNGLVIAHDDGWETQYCHLRKGSVAVQPGEAVYRGDRLGLVGMSGRAEFPHVQLGVRRDGVALDPFTGKEVGSGCGMLERSLWHADSRPAYAASQIVAAGFATGAIKMEELQQDATSPAFLGADSPALVLWVVTLGLEPGDLLRLAIAAPDGSTVFTHEKTLERTQIRRLDYGGRRMREDGWEPGVYVGEASLLRPGSGAERAFRVQVTLR